MSTPGVSNDYVPDIYDILLSVPKCEQITSNSISVWGTSGSKAYITIYLLDDQETCLKNETLPYIVDGFFSYSFKDLTPGTSYFIYFLAKDPDDTTQEYRTTSVQFTTATSSSEITEIFLSPQETSVSNEFKVSFNFLPNQATWPSWYSASKKGYELTFLLTDVNSKQQIKQIKYYFTPVKTTYELNLNSLFGFKPSYGSFLQVGIRAFVEVNNKKIFNSDFINYSNSICLKENFYVFNRVYIKTPFGRRLVNIYLKEQN